MSHKQYRETHEQDLSELNENLREIKIELEKSQINKNQLERQIEGMKKASQDREIIFANEKEELRKTLEKNTEQKLVLDCCFKEIPKKKK